MGFKSEIDTDKTLEDNRSTEVDPGSANPNNGAIATIGGTGGPSVSVSSNAGTGVGAYIDITTGELMRNYAPEKSMNELIALGIVPVSDRTLGELDAGTRSIQDILDLFAASPSHADLILINKQPKPTVEEMAEKLAVMPISWHSAAFEDAGVFDILRTDPNTVIPVSMGVFANPIAFMRTVYANPIEVTDASSAWFADARNNITPAVAIFDKNGNRIALSKEGSGYQWTGILPNYAVHGEQYSIETGYMDAGGEFVSTWKRKIQLDRTIGDPPPKNVIIIDPTSKFNSETGERTTVITRFETGAGPEGVWELEVEGFVFLNPETGKLMHEGGWEIPVPGPGDLNLLEGKGGGIGNVSVEPGLATDWFDLIGRQEISTEELLIVLSLWDPLAQEDSLCTNGTVSGPGNRTPAACYYSNDQLLNVLDLWNPLANGTVIGKVGDNGAVVVEPTAGGISKKAATAVTVTAVAGVSIFALAKLFGGR